MHKVFISYHHENDQRYKDALAEFGHKNSIFIDESVDTGDISDDLNDESIREKIRDEYLRDSTVTKWPKAAPLVQLGAGHMGSAQAKPLPMEGF